MPFYLFSNPNNESEVKEIFFHMNDIKEYSENGVQWNRVFVSPSASVDSQVDPNNPKDFIKHTGNKSGTLGDLQDLSAELSQKRADKNGGVDPVKEEVYKKYKETRKRDHPEVKKKKLKEKLKGNKFIELSD